MATTEKQKALNNDYYKRNAPEIQAQRKARHSTPEYKEWYRQYNDRNRERIRARAIVTHRRVRSEALAIYGGKCACCGESRFEFLSFDHINGGGTQHRKSMGGSQGASMAHWLRRNGYPQGYIRVLCHNCNLAIGFYKVCPHNKNKKDDDKA